MERAKANVEHRLKAYDERGEEGLQDELGPDVSRNKANAPDRTEADVTEGTSQCQPEVVSQAQEATETSADGGLRPGEIPGTRVAFGHGMYAFDVGGEVPMHVVVGPPVPIVRYQPGMEPNTSRSPETSADDAAPAAEEQAAPTSDRFS